MPEKVDALLQEIKRGVFVCMKMKQVTDALLRYDSMNESLAERHDGFCTYATLCNSLFIPLVFD